MINSGFFEWSYENDHNVFGGAAHDGDECPVNKLNCPLRSVYPPL